FLNYHYHLEHHRDPDCPWRGLPDRARNSKPPIRFLAILYLMWRGPRLLPGSAQGLARERLLNGSIVACHIAVFAAAFGLIYGLSSLDYLSRTTLYDVALPIDGVPHFVPLTVFIYVTITPFLAIAPVVLRTPERTLPLLAALLIELLVAGLCF